MICHILLPPHFQYSRTPGCLFDFPCHCTHCSLSSWTSRAIWYLILQVPFSSWPLLLPLPFVNESHLEPWWFWRLLRSISFISWEDAGPHKGSGVYCLPCPCITLISPLRYSTSLFIPLLSSMKLRYYHITKHWASLFLSSKSNLSSYSNVRPRFWRNALK